MATTSRPDLRPVPTPGSGSDENDFTPYITADREVTEFTISAVVIGALLGLLFAASSVYLALKIGLTVSASIPIAVLSITIFRSINKALGVTGPQILRNNIVQTTGSAGESIASGVVFRAGVSACGKPLPAVPRIAVFCPSRVSACAVQWATEVLPLDRKSVV